MDFILQVVQSRAAKVVAAFLFLALVFGGTLFLLRPRDSRFVIQTGGESPSQPPTGELTPPLSRSPSPQASPAQDVSPTSSPERTQIIVVVQLAGASAEEYSRVVDGARSLGYPVRSAPPASEAIERSVIKYRPGTRQVAERLASDVRPSALLFEEPLSGADLWLILGRS